MSLEFNELVKLAKATVKADRTAPVAYSFGENNLSYSELNDTLRAELKSLAPNFREYKKNQNTIFELLEQTIEDVLPAKVMEQYGAFADIKTFGQGDKPIFTQRITTASKRRAKQFIGKVGMAGLYEVFKLDGKSYEVPTDVLGGAAQIGFEEFLDGRVDFADVLDIVMESLDECIYVEIAKQLYGVAAALKAAGSENYHEANAFIEADFDHLIGISDSYGKSVIYCDYEFAAQMVPSDARMSEAHKNALWDNGYIGNYKGHQVIVLRNSYTDETNKIKTVHPGYCWIIPVGTEKPVKIAFEGDTIVDEYAGYDRSREVQIYKKVGVRAIFSNAMTVYNNTSLKRGNE